MTTLTCYIYRCSAKADMYLYLRQRDDFACLPDALVKNIGRLDFAMQLDLHAEKKLARENPAIIMENLQKQGFHLQMPGDIAIDDILARIAEERLKAASQQSK
jgi:uncharacterized protein